MSATAIAPEETIVQQPRAVTTFLSRRQNLRLVKKRRRHLRNLDNEVVGETPGETVEFVVYIDPARKEQLIAGGMDVREAQAAARYGRFECPMEGMVELAQGAEIEAGELHEWLSKHRLNGDMVEGFWRLDPVAPPISGEEIKALGRLQLALDEERIEALIASERAGWNRAGLIDAAEDALAGVREIRAAAEAEAEPEPEPESKGKAGGKAAGKE